MRFSFLQIIVLSMVVGLLVAMMLFLYRTSFGRQIRARSAATRRWPAVGVNPALVYFQTFFISGRWPVWRAS